MLTLTRKKNEAIMIDGGIEIQVLEVKGDKVKIGINAPKDIGIYREEVYKLVQASNKEASNSNKQSLNSLKELLIKKGK